MELSQIGEVLERILENQLLILSDCQTIDAGELEGAVKRTEALLERL